MNLLRVADMIDQIGAAVTLRRPTGPSGITFDVPLMAVIRGYAPNELVGGIQQGDRRAIVSNRFILERQWPGPPRRGDQLIVDGRTTTIQAVDSTEVGDLIVKHELQIRG